MTRRCSQDRWGIEHLFLAILLVATAKELFA